MLDLDPSFRPVRRPGGYLPLEDLGLIGDGTTAALIGLDGSIPWMCLPRFNSEPPFCGLLDHAEGGHFTVAPEDLVEARQRYEPDTGVLTTELRSATGTVRITDALVLRSGADLTDDAPADRAELVRSAVVLSGNVRLLVDLTPRGGGQARALFSGLEIRASRRPDLRLHLRSNLPLTGLRSTHDLQQGDRLDLVLSWGRFHRHHRFDAEAMLSETAEAWRRWMRHFSYRGPEEPLVRRVGSRAIDAFTRCRVIARYGTGVDIVDVAAATRRGIQVTNAPNEWCAEEVADHAVALWLAAARRICEYDRATRQGEWHWETGQPIWRLRGRVFGLLSFGSIARLIAERAQAFGVEVWAHDPYLDESEIRSRQVRPVSFDDLVEGADYLVIQSPLTPQTHHTFDRTTLCRMKPTAILINTARGPIVEDTAIYQALTEGWIAGAALDDIEEEPAKQRDWRPSNPLLTLPNVIITPHAAYYSEEAITSVRRIAAEEAVRVLTGQPPRSPVNDVTSAP